MERKFDFDKIGKRLPYTVPAGTFEEIERNVSDAFSTRKYKARKSHLFRWSVGLTAAAGLALLIAVDITSQDKSREIALSEIDLAYAHLSESDQEYIVEIYNDDIFINQK